MPHSTLWRKAVMTSSPHNFSCSHEDVCGMEVWVHAFLTEHWWVECSASHSNDFTLGESHFCTCWKYLLDPIADPEVQANRIMTGHARNRTPGIVWEMNGNTRSGVQKTAFRQIKCKEEIKIHGMKEKDERTAGNRGTRSSLDCGCSLLLTGLNASYIIVSKWVLHVYCSPKANPWPTSSVPLLFGNKCYWKKAPGLCKAFPSTTWCVSLSSKHNSTLPFIQTLSLLLVLPITPIQISVLF